MEELDFSLFWIVAISSFCVWGAGIYLVLKGWTDRGEQVSFEPVLKEKPQLKEQIVRERKIELQAPEKEAKLEELEIPVTQERELEPQIPEREEGVEEFYRDFGKPNIIEFPAEYISQHSVKGLDGREAGFIEFAKNCYTQIGFRCIDTVLTEKLPDRLYRVSIFDLVCDHYTSDEQSYIDFFGKNKEKLSNEIISLKSNPEFIYKNMKELTASYENLPQLIAWNDKELILVLVKSKNEELTLSQLHWLRKFIIQRKLFRARIFKIVEKKFAEPTPAEPTPVETTPVETTPVETTPVTKKPPVEKITRKPFTKEEIEFLKKNRGRMTNEEMAQKLNRSVDSITHKLSRLGMSRETFEWRKAKENFLKNNLQRLSYKKLAERLGTTVPSVRARCKKLGLK